MVTIDLKKLYAVAKKFGNLKGDNCKLNNILLDAKSNSRVSFARIGFTFNVMSLEDATLNMMVINCPNDIEYRVEFESSISYSEFQSKLTKKIQEVGYKLKKQYSTVATTGILL
jgi:hypothetical protein